MRIPEDLLDAIRRSTDAGELVGRYVPLKRSGRALKGLCPFHQEKTPSFQVRPDMGIWKCFGCGAGGNVFTFLMQREGLRFGEAVRQLAHEAGIPLPEDDDPEAALRAARAARLREVTEWACRQFQSALKGPEGEPGRAYFKRRGIQGTTALEFRLGYAPPGWDRMLLAARRDGIPEQDLLDAGLVIAREGRDGCYDRFRDRVVFPISDAGGKVIAFGARTLGNDEPKYLNSPETPLYTKGRHLYAFHLAKQEILRTGEAAVMEGYTDVILAHQSGFKVAVAGLGTALTPDQARKLAQYAKKLWLVYDGDTAGLRAAEKAIPAFLPEPIETRVCVLPGEKDPADVFVEDGADAFRASLAASREAFEHLLGARRAAHDFETVPGRTAAAEECLAALTGVEDEIRRALYLKRLADEYGVPEEVAARKLEEIRARARASSSRSASPRSPSQSAPPRTGPRPAPERRGPAPGAAGQPGGAVSPRGASSEEVSVPPVDDAAPFEALPPGAGAVSEDLGDGDLHGSVPSAAAPVAPVPEEPPAGPPPALERLLVEALLGEPSLLAECPDWLPGALTHGPCRRLVTGLLAARDASPGGVPDVDRFLGMVPEVPLAALGADLRSSGQGKRLAEQARDCLRRLAALHEDSRLREELRGTDSSAEEAELLRKLQDLHRRRAGR